MAYATVTFENPLTGKIRNAPVGFSWTVFFFGFIPPLFRSDWKWAVIILVCALITWGLSNLIFCFIYNRFYIKDLISDGYKQIAIEGATTQSVEGKIGMRIPTA